MASNKVNRHTRCWKVFNRNHKYYEKQNHTNFWYGWTICQQWVLLLLHVSPFTQDPVTTSLWYEPNLFLLAQNPSSKQIVPNDNTYIYIYIYMYIGPRPFFGCLGMSQPYYFIISIDLDKFCLDSFLLFFPKKSAYFSFFFVCFHNNTQNW